VIGTVAAAALALVGVSVAAAQSSGTTTPSTTAPTTPANGAPKPHGPRGFGGGPGPFFGGPGIGPGGAIYGTYVRPNPTGGYETITFQTGTASNVSTGSITVTSADGHKVTYTVSSNTSVNGGQTGINSVATGHMVSVQAQGSGPSPAATSIIDMTALGNNRQHWNPAPPSTAPSTTTPTTTKP
jgi:hypothetical protein